MTEPKPTYRTEHTFTIPDHRAVSWNKLYQQKHWTYRQQLAQEIHMLVMAHTEHVELSFPVDIEITAYMKGQVMDADNLCAKLYIDGLKFSLLPDDTGQYVRKVTTQTERSKSDYVEVRIHETTD